MTGYGRREAAWAGGTVAAEMRSVNHRFCEIIIRLPKMLSGMEDELKRIIQQQCARGRIELGVFLAGGKEAGKCLTLDRVLVRQYYRLLCELQRDLRLSGSIDVALLTGFRDIISVVDRPVLERRLVQIVKRLVSAALSDLVTMRRREGTVLAQDARVRLRSIHDAKASIGARAPLVAQGYFERMKSRVKKLAGSDNLDQGRLYQELAAYADRCDVTEELTRLDSHLAQFDASLRKREPVGKMLDFLLQEMGRETNTIGSKANDAEIATHVVRIKSELEKIREQVQNIE
jgi:uncharacterized protein (TIGR00255 family)